MANNVAMDITDYKKLILEYTKRSNSELPLYHFQQDSKYLPCNFYCSLLVCGRSFSTHNAFSTKDEAEYEVNRQACYELSLINPTQNLYNSVEPYVDPYVDSYAVPSFGGSYQVQNIQQRNQTPGYDTSFSNNGELNEFPPIDDTLSPTIQHNIPNRGINNGDFHSKQKKGHQYHPYKPNFNSTNKQKTIQPDLYKSFIPAGHNGSQYFAEERNQRNNVQIKKSFPNPPKLQNTFKKLVTTNMNKSMANLMSGPIPVSTIDDIWQYLTDAVLATSFKSFLHYFAQEENHKSPKYEVYKASENGVTGFKGKVNFKDMEFNSLGLMRHKKQAEMSAAEVCLRSLNFLPGCSKQEEFTIQPFQGGLLKGQMKQRTRCFAILSNFMHHLGIVHPAYGIKQINKEETCFDGVCWMDDKVFTSANCSSVSEAKVKVSLMALEYLNVPVDKQTGLGEFVVKMINGNLNLRFSAPSISPFQKTPSMAMSWLHKCVVADTSPSHYNGENINVDVIKEKMNIHFTAEDNSSIDPYSAFLNQTPIFAGVPLAMRADIAVGQLCADNPNLVLLGNKEFAIKLYCKDRKMYCKQRDCSVDLMAGHRITGLECHFVTLPSLDVYLAAHACHDLHFPNPAKPVIRSCNAILILHDQDVRDSPHVLIQRSITATGFAAQSSLLSEYLCGVITGRCNNQLDVGALTANIASWEKRDVELLSEMSMDSMQELYSKFQTYDDRWNEVLMRPPTPELRTLKNACLSELSQRGTNRPPSKTVEKHWQVPRFEFRPRIIPTGPFIERSSLCFIRGLRNETGIRLKIGDVDSIPYVDIPTICENTRGAFDRYYIWAKSKEVKEDGEVKDTYLSECNVNFESDDWVEISHKTKQNIERNKRASEMNIASGSDQRIEPLNENEAAVTSEEKTIEVPKKQKQKIELTTVTKECRWFSLMEASTLNPSFGSLIESLEFQNALKSLSSDRPSR